MFSHKKMASFLLLESNCYFFAFMIYCASKYEKPIRKRAVCRKMMTSERGSEGGSDAGEKDKRNQ